MKSMELESPRASKSNPEIVLHAELVGNTISFLYISGIHCDHAAVTRLKPYSMAATLEVPSVPKVSIDLGRILCYMG